MDLPFKMFDASRNYWNHAKRAAQIAVVHVLCNNIATDALNHALSLLEEDHYVSLKLLDLFFDSLLKMQQTNTCKWGSSLLICRLLFIF